MITFGWTLRNSSCHDTSDTTFLESLGVKVVRIGFSHSTAIGKMAKGYEVVYHCTADAMLHTQIRLMLQ